MAVSQNPQNPQNPQRTPQEQEAREQVRYLDEQALSLKNILSLKRQISKADKEEQNLREQIVNLGRQQARNAIDYKQQTEFIKQLQDDLRDNILQGNASSVRALKVQITMEQARAAEMKKTAGGALAAQALEAKKRKDALTAERNLVKDINSKRNIGTRLMDLFKSKEARQRQIDLARAQTQGGANLPPGGGAGGGKGAAAAAAGAGLFGGIAAGLMAGAKALMGPLKALGGLAQKAIVAPFADAAQLLTGENFGMGSGKVRTTGVGGLLGGVQEFASAIPIIGGLMGSLVGVVKTIVEGILGIEQGIFRFARAINVSYGQANRMRSSFAAIAASSGNIAINADRMMQSQAEIGNQLGINKQLSGDILKNDVLLRDVVGTEAEIRQSIAATSITSGKNAIKLTQSLIGTVGVFNKLRGTSFSFNGIMKEAAKLTGVIGLTFSKYPEKIAKALMSAKALGMELQQLDSIGSSLLDFETSISKEMEAQVLTGREMNLTLAREAALNNDYATLTEEIAKNVGDSTQFLELNRIQQEAIAESVGMTANSLADVLKKQELYKQLGATDLKTFHEKIALLEKQGKTQEQISAMIGKDAYNAYTQISTAERLTEILEGMKRTFVELIRQSGIFDFITKPEKITAFVRALADKLASVIDIVGRIVAGIMEGVAYVVGLFSDQKAQEIRSLAGSVRAGTGTFAESMRIATGAMGGTPAPSVGTTVENTTRQQAAATATKTAEAKSAAAQQQGRPLVLNNYLQVDKDVLAKNTVEAFPRQWQTYLQ
jgi:hypothetical protein